MSLASEILDFIVRHREALSAVFILFFLAGSAGLIRALLAYKADLLFSHQLAPLPQTLPRKVLKTLLILLTAMFVLTTSWAALVAAIRVAAIAWTSVVEPTKYLELPQRSCPRSKNATKMLLFIHGWRGDKEETWREFPALACRDKRFQDTEIVIVAYPTYMVRQNLKLTHLASWLNTAFAAKEWKSYKQIAIFAHSLGGLVAREMVIGSRLAEDPRTFALLIEVASPHSGTDVAKVGSVLGISRILLKEAEVGSTFLLIQQDHWEKMKTRPRTYCFTSPHDWVVPSESAVAQCDFSVRHPQWDHIELVKPENERDPRYVLPMMYVEELF